MKLMCAAIELLIVGSLIEEAWGHSGPGTVVMVAAFYIWRTIGHEVLTGTSR